MNDVPITFPGRYAPGVAVSFADPTGQAKTVSETSPLPVTLAAAGSTSTTTPTPLTGTASTALAVGPFAAATGRPILLSLTGTWAGTVRVLRSVDGGTTRLPLTLAGVPWGIFTANVCEPIWEETEAGVQFYLQLAPSSGTVTYRMAQ